MARVRITRPELAPVMQASGPSVKGERRGAYRKLEKSERILRKNRKKLRHLAILATHEAKSGGREADYLGAPHDQMVFDLRLAGLTRDQIAAVFGISYSSLYVWLRNHPSFFAAWQQGGPLADAAIARKLFMRAHGFTKEVEKVAFDSKAGDFARTTLTEYFPPDVGAQTLWLANRQRDAWKTSRSATELTGADGAPLIPPQVIINPVAPLPQEETGT